MSCRMVTRGRYCGLRVTCNKRKGTLLAGLHSVLLYCSHGFVFFKCLLRPT